MAKSSTTTQWYLPMSETLPLALLNVERLPIAPRPRPRQGQEGGQRFSEGEGRGRERGIGRTSREGREQ